MKTKLLIASAAVLLASCVGEDLPVATQTSETETIQIESDVLTFNSVDDFRSQLDAMHEADSYDVTHATRTRAGGSDFVSLRDKLIADVMKGFTPEELQEIEREGLIYEPEDELICDPFMMSVMNENREVMIGDKMYRFVEEGLVEYTPTPENIEIVNDVYSGNSSETRSNASTRALPPGIKFTPIYYKPWEEQNESTQTATRAVRGDLFLDNGRLTIPGSNVAAREYTKNGGTWLSRIFGTNITIDNNFDKKHRMKLRLYDQEYLIYRAIGMTVRMQKKTLGIWWRIKAQEFVYGWTAIEVRYKWAKPALPRLNPPGMPQNVPPLYDIPVTINKKFPFKNEDITFLHFKGYDLDTGDINKVFEAGTKALAKEINALVGNNPKLKGLIGFYVVGDDAKTFHYTFPPDEQKAYNDGREVVRWDMQWLSGNVVFGYSTSTLNPLKLKYEGVSFSQAINTDIMRGTVVGAAKYDGKWRACMIYTK